jgi:hypothetical protein
LKALEIRKAGSTGGPREKFNDDENYSKGGVSSDDSSSSITLMRI